MWYLPGAVPDPSEELQKQYFAYEQYCHCGHQEISLLFECLHLIQRVVVLLPTARD